MKDKIAEMLIKKEKSILTDKVRRDPEALAALLHPAFIEYTSSGEICDRQNILEEVPGEEQGLKISGKNFNVRFLSDNLAQVTFESATASQKGTKKALRSSLWKLEGKKWMMIFHQGTPQE